MNHKSSPIVYFGSGNLSAKCFERLIKWQRVSKLVTKSSSLFKGGNGMVKICQDLGIEILTADNTKELENLINEGFISKYNSAVLIDYGVIINDKVIESFESGIINSHFSSLPDWRGADPITYSFLSGSKTGNVTLMYIDSGMDTGKIIDKDNFLYNYASLQDIENKFVDVSDELLKKHLNFSMSKAYKIRSKKQNGIIRYSRKLKKEDGIIDFHKHPSAICREIIAMNTWPKSVLKTHEEDLIIKSAFTDLQNIHPKLVGRLYAKNNQLFLGCVLGSINITYLQRPGKRIVSAKDFLIGLTKLKRVELETLGLEVE